MKLIDQEAAVALVRRFFEPTPVNEPQQQPAGLIAALRAVPPVEAAGMGEFESALIDYGAAAHHGSRELATYRQRVLDLYARAAAGKEKL